MEKISSTTKFPYLISKSLYLTLIISVFTLLVAQYVSAGSSNTIPQYGFLGGTTAYAEIKSFHSPESSNGYCNIKSYTSPSTSINVIGWTWWQCDRLRSNGSIVQSISYGGSAKNDSSNQQGFTWLNAFTGGTTKLKAHGVHDFNHTGSSPSPWRPYNVNTYQ
ncbi:MAG: hypothetical protein GY943_20365 [Chloroflexi bacterium]|nr:hypothetical protein [Chloroflexota bacterium]